MFDIGASWAVFQRKHINPAEHITQWQRLRRSERARLLRHLVGGGLEPRDVRRLMGRLDQGYKEGGTRAFGAKPLPVHPVSPFERFPFKPLESVLSSTRTWGAKAHLRKAADRVNEGAIVTLLSLSPTALYHQVSFNDDGVWVQRGGVFGKSDRASPLFRMTTRQRRAEKERARVASQRGFS
jgi:hypothetical protein